MSRDGRAEPFPEFHKRGSGWGETRSIPMDCGGVLVGAHGGRFRSCSLGHVHCSRCGKEAHRHRKGWTCGMCTRTLLHKTHIDLVSISHGTTLIKRTQIDDPLIGSQVKAGWATYVYINEPHTMDECPFKGPGVYADDI